MAPTQEMESGLIEDAPTIARAVPLDRSWPLKGGGTRVAHAQPDKDALLPDVSQDHYQGSFIRMSLQAPRRLLELACQGLLKDEASAIAALESLPVELFPPLFVAAFTGKHTKVLKMMVQAWPFPCLPLGALMKDQQPDHEIFQAALDGLDALLAQATRPR